MSPKSSLPPAGVPHSGGNAKYAVIAILLLLGIGGLVWRIMAGHSDSTPAPAPSVALSTPAPTNPRLDDVPPPPPPDDKPEAGPTGPRIVYVPVGGCDGKCVGKAPPELYQAVQVRGMQARRCYNQALSRDSSLKGHVSVAVRIGPSGNICSATVASNDMGTPGVAECAANIFRSVGGYPSPRGGCVDMNVPLSFVPQGQ